MVLPPPPIKSLSWRYHLTILDFIVILTGLIFSPPLLSIGLIGVCVVGILDIPKGVNPTWKKNIRAGLADPFNWAMASLYLILLFGCWQTDDWGYYLDRLRIKLALLFVPIGWWGLPKLQTEHRYLIMAFFGVLMSFVAVGVMINYSLHFAEIQQGILEGRSIPVPRNHIRFSLLVALATLGALELWRVRALGRSGAWLGLAFFLFAFQHLLAVRSGLAGAYLGVVAFLVAYLVETKQWKVGLLGLAFLFVLPLIGYNLVPSLRAKIDYLNYEVWRQEEGLDNQAYSDAGRITSIRFGLELWQENPLLGVGPGNLRQRMDQLYAQRLPAAEAKRPHNQFVSILAGSGVMGLLVFMAAVSYLALGQARWRNPVFLGALVIILASCMVENTLENSAGLGIFCFFLFFYRPDSPRLRSAE